MSIAESLIALIQDEGRDQAFSRVTQISVELGALGHVEPDALRFCFDVVSHGTIAEGARLDLRTIPGKGWCPGCNGNVLIEERYDSCPDCGHCPVQMTAGDELRLAELEVE